MRARASLFSAAVLLVLFFLCSYRDGKSADASVKGNAQSQPQSGPPTLAIYASDPDTIWNRLFRLFYVRHTGDGQQYGGDELDPYLWWQTKYLLSGSSHDEHGRAFGPDGDSVVLRVGLGVPGPARSARVQVAGPPGNRRMRPHHQDR